MHLRLEHHDREVARVGVAFPHTHLDIARLAFPPAQVRAHAGAVLVEDGRQPEDKCVRLASLLLLLALLLLLVSGGGSELLGDLWRIRVRARVRWRTDSETI